MYEYGNRQLLSMQYHNTMIHTGLYFDVDYANRDYDEGAIQVGKLLDLIEEKIP